MDISRTACMALRIATDRCPNPLDKIYLKKKKNGKGGKWGGRGGGMHPRPFLVRPRFKGREGEVPRKQSWAIDGLTSYTRQLFALGHNIRKLSLCFMNHSLLNGS